MNVNCWYFVGATEETDFSEEGNCFLWECGHCWRVRGVTGDQAPWGRGSAPGGEPSKAPVWGLFSTLPLDRVGLGITPESDSWCCRLAAM